VGHFRAEDPKSWASRVIMNDQGHFWLMFKCGENVECVYAEADLGAISVPGTFKAQSETGLPHDVVVSAWSQDRLILDFSRRGSYTFVRAPVSYNETVSAPGKSASTALSLRPESTATTSISFRFGCGNQAIVGSPTMSDVTQSAVRQ
jgi:hypothetical protein